ncbi:signal recognition particle, SRP14 subunit [Rhodotorula toruloides]|uniref:Signal recognition particle, SRP14 subunit n=1 Tax=Rhodotorula toruloides TaxID=5286 RepID=A0A511KAF1_RHOTO|nr:signal recognition particle, SRP14 subunit [Rhodotorula toruloides]
MRDPDAEREWPLLIRATDGNGKKDVKVKISTIVQPSSSDAFLTSYSDLLRTHFSSTLRPKRKKADLARQKALKLAKRRAAKAKVRGEEVDPSALAAAGSYTTGAGGGQFVLRLPKVVGPRRGNGVKKRRRALKRREKAVERYNASKARKRGADDV